MNTITLQDIINTYYQRTSMQNDLQNIIWQENILVHRIIFRNIFSYQMMDRVILYKCIKEIIPSPWYSVCIKRIPFLHKKIAIRLHFLKSYSFAINDIKLLFNICISRLLLNFLHLSTINRENSTVTICLLRNHEQDRLRTTWHSASKILSFGASSCCLFFCFVLVFCRYAFRENHIFQEYKFLTDESGDKAYQKGSNNSTFSYTRQSVRCDFPLI